MHFQVLIPEKSRKNIFRDKETLNKMLMSLRKAKYCNFGPSQETSTVQCIYLAFQGLKISSKKGQKWSES